MTTPLESWNDGVARNAILDFVTKVTTPGSPDFVPEPERIATFDNDVTLWCEQPVPVQFFFALDRVQALLPQHPEWKDQEPFASLLQGNLNAALAGGDQALLELLMATHTGMTTVEFEQIVKDWLATAKHSQYNRPYTECVYQPMLELLAYLSANGFKNYIVSAGGIEFMRAWSEPVYGIPPEQVISSIQTKLEIRDGQPVLVRLPLLNFNGDKDGKPVAINQQIGRRPVMVFGNSTGDQQMLEYTQGGSGARFMLLILHDDAAREVAYGPARGLPDVKLGAFPPVLDEQAKKEGWIVAIGLAGIVGKPTPELLKLQADIIAAVAPFTVDSGTMAAFTSAHDDPAIDAQLIEYVSKFVPKKTGEQFSPHVTTGVAPRDDLDKMLAEPFEPFTFSPAGAAVYQLGPFGTAAKELKAWDLKA